jgi:HAE1 family hydrophobic/amphiphilic exporter-1
MYAGHVSLNIMSLGGLALGVGMVVDASIVVLEAVSRRRDLGDDLVTAAIRGTREVAGAITGSTLTSVAVFAPIVFVHGVAGRIFGDQALTVVSSHLVSLLVAVVFIPMLVSRRWLSPGTASVASPYPAGSEVAPAAVSYSVPVMIKARAAPSTRVPSGFEGSINRVLSGIGRLCLWVGGWFVRIAAGIAWLVYKAIDLLLRPLLIAHDWVWVRVERTYPRVLAAALRNAWLVVFVAFVLFGLAAWRLTHLGVDLLPEIHQGEFTARIGLQVGTPIESTDEVVGAIDRSVRAIPGVMLTAVVVGVEKDTLTRDVEGKHTARLTVRLDPKLANPRDEDRLLAQVRHCIDTNPAVTSVDITRPTPFALDAPVQVEVLGSDLDELRTVGQQVAERLSHVHGLTDVRTSVRAGHPEARVTFDRDKMLEYGLDLSAVSQLVRNQVLGNVSTRFTEGDDRIDVRVIGDEVVLGNLDRVLDLVVNPSAETPVPLRDIATVSVVQGPAEIRRIGNTRAVLVTAATTGLDLGGVTKRIEAALAGMDTPDDVVVQLGGQKREMDDAQQSMAFALLLALFLVYVVMASQFESLMQPLIILVTVPLAFVGVVFALDALSIPVSVVVFIGLILLAGIVVANAIVLITRINQNREQGAGLFDAVVEAGGTRLRPIYMTANTTVIGLLPMTGWLIAVPLIGAMGSGAGAELRAPMAVTVVTGMTCSTILTLVVIPCIYYLMYRRKEARAS